MTVAQVLSEIVGVPCGNVSITVETPSMEFFHVDEYVHGMTRVYLSFTTKKPLDLWLGENPRFGSIFLASSVNRVEYTAMCLKGEETTRLMQALADMCK